MITCLSVGLDPSGRGADHYGVTVMYTDQPVTDPDAQWYLAQVLQLPGGGPRENFEQASEIVTQVCTLAADHEASVLVAVDATGAGTYDAEALKDWSRKATLPVEPVVRGAVLSTTLRDRTLHNLHWLRSVNREDAIQSYRNALDGGQIDAKTSLPEDDSRTLASEMKTFRESATPGGRRRLEHAPGEHDDALFSGALAWWVRGLVRPSVVANAGLATESRNGGSWAQMQQSALAQLRITRGR